MSQQTITSVQPRCHLPWQQMVVDSTGYVSPCCCNQRSAIGNVNEQSIEEIWNGPGYQRLRKYMAEGNLHEAGCGDCLARKQGMTLGFMYDQDSDQNNSTPYAENITILKEEIASGETVLKARPTIVSLTPSHRCNIRRAHCYQESTRSLDLGRREVNQEVLDLAPYLVRLIAGGGEPFLMPLWRQFLNDFEHDKNPYLDFATTTNGTLISSEIEEGLAKFKKVTLNVSLDGTDRVFEAIRAGANFAKVKENIRKLRRIVDLSTSPLSTMGVTMCVMKSNIKDLPNLIRFASEEEITYGLNPVRKQPPDESLACFNDPEQETQGWHEAYDEARQVARDVYYPILNRLDKLPRHRDYREVLSRHIEVVRQSTPWDLLGKKYFRVRIELPKRILSMTGSDVPAGSRPMAQVFPAGTVLSSPPLYYAYLKDNWFDVSLPEGTFNFSLSSKWILRGPTPGLRFIVKKSGTKAKVKYLDGLYIPTHSERLRSQAEAHWEQAKAHWEQLRGHVRKRVAPYPVLFNSLKFIHSIAGRWMG